MKIVKDYISELRKIDAYPDIYTVVSKEGNLIAVKENNFDRVIKAINFCSNDILGLSQSEAVKQAAINAIYQYGTSNSGCSLLSGRIQLHGDLEKEISLLKNLPYTHLFLNAWMAMKGFMESFCHLAMKIPGFEYSQETLILTDIQNHGCITAAITDVSGGKISGQIFSRSPKVRYFPYRHCDAQSLSDRLKKHAKSSDRIVVVSDAVFSMEGNIAPLPDIVKVLENYENSVLLMDEAHSSGAIGANGGGIYEHFNLLPKELLDRGIHPIIMTTFSKFAASAGAAISCFSSEMIDLLNVSRPSAGTISLPPSTTAAALESIRQLRQNSLLTNKLQKNSYYLRESLKREGFDMAGETNLIPVFLPPLISPKKFAQKLLHEYGFWVSPVWYVSKPLLRIVVNVLHTQAEMDRLVTSMKKVREMVVHQNPGSNRTKVPKVS